MNLLNLYQRTMHRLFGFQYAALKSGVPGDLEVRRAHLVGGRYYVYPEEGSYARVALQKRGEVSPRKKACTWRPLTEGLDHTFYGGSDK